MKKNDSKQSIIQGWRSVILSLAIVLFCMVLVSVYPLFVKVTYKDMSKWVKAKVTYVNGEEKSFTGTEFGPINRGDQIEAQVDLPIKDKVDPGVMVFGINHAVIEVTFQDSVLVSYGEDIDERGDLIAHHIYFVNIPDEAWGKSITISIRATEEKAFNRIAKLWLYPAAKAYKYYFDLEFGRMVVSISVMIMSIITMFSMLFLMKNEGKRHLQLLFVSLFGILSTLWMTLAEGLQQFWGVDSYLLTTFEYVAFAAQMIPLCAFIIVDEANAKKKRILLGLVGADLLYVTIICILNYCNIAHFSVTVTPTIVFIIINGAVFVANSISNMDFSMESKRISLLGVSVLCLNGIFDVVRFSLYRSIGTQTFNKTQKTFPLGVLIFFVFLVISALVSEREKQEMEKQNKAKLLTKQIQPHFLYNTLASIREIIFEDPEYAAETLTDFTTYLRGAVRAMSDVQVIDFSEELKNIKAYAEIEKMRMSERLLVKYDIEESDFVVPPFSVQPLVENAIRHGIYKRGKEGGTVTVRTFAKDDEWVIVVMDDGVGFNVQDVMGGLENKDNKSAGMKNLITRLREIIHASVSFQSDENEGTVVTITIPQKYNKIIRNAERSQKVK